MSSLKLLHCADLHLGSKISFLGHNADVLQSEQLLCFERIIGLCNTREIDLLIIAGDLFDSPDVSDALLLRVRELLLSLKNTVVAICAGNHDPLSYGASAIERLGCGERVVILNKQNPVVQLDGKNARIYGSSFYGAYLNSTDPFSDFNIDPSYLNIAVIHGDLNAEQGSNYNPVTTAQIERSGFDYVALGHIHARSEILKAGNTFFAYPGCVQGTGFDELGEKGVYIGTISKDRCDFEFQRIANRLFINESIDISECLTNGQIVEKIKSALSKFENAANNLYKITLTGGTDQSLSVDPSYIAASLASEYFFIKVIDTSAPAIDLELLAKQNTLKGMFVKRMLDMLNGAEDPELVKQALQIGLKAFDGEVKAIDN
ncbi:MAG: metallophosphoesterase [Clostridia bacterium]|nr:metallophosphoesterase [Clostridia bacterium]